MGSDSIPVLQKMAALYEMEALLILQLREEKKSKESEPNSEITYHFRCGLSNCYE
jgi:hypothetical protein